MINKVKLIFYKFVPTIHDLPQVIFIRWMDHEWFIKK